MTDTGLKKLLVFLLKNKKLLSSLLDHFKPEDIEKGMLAIPDSILNRDIKMLVMDKASPYLNDYQLSFQQNSIFIDLDVNAKQLGRLKAKYLLTFSEMDFYGDVHQVSFTYQEDVRSEGNFMQSMALKAAGLKGNYLQTAAEMAKLDFLAVSKESLTIDMDALDPAKKIPSSLKITFISCEDGMLKLKFNI